MPGLKFGLKPETIAIIIKEISSFKEISHAVVFGSRAKGNYKKGSDIDIAIKGHQITDDTVVRLSTRLNQEAPIPYFVDVVHYEGITNRELVDHIDRVGKIFWSS
ncbi:MAG: nucleotidyltransferase domain-containing protein [Desulfobacterium sp.]|jgi:predicted nucleotidyltransferase|nr:nucleotidyltransferase domain-containing protein [Desulfobacterium sp.]